MGHISPRNVHQLIDNGLVTGIKLKKSSVNAEVFCESCVYAKATRKPIAKVREGKCAKNFGDKIHTDLWGPAPVETKGGRKYYITFTDDAMRFTHLYLLRAKSEAFEAYKKYEAWCLTQKNTKIKVLHSDQGGEYLDTEFRAYLAKQGTTQKLTVHHTPAHNGVAKHRNRTIIERVHALLHGSGLPRSLW